jgi:hypothetical protein
MRVTTVLSTAMLLLLPGAIATAYAQEHEQERKPAEQKQQQAKPAPHQQEVKPVKQQPQAAQHEQQAKPAQQRQQAAQHEQQAKPAQQRQQAAQHQQEASRSSQTAGGHGSIPEARFHASFGSSHTFHVNRSEFANGSGRFQYGGYWFNAVQPWPVGWLYTDNVYVDYLNGGYFLCDPVHPGVFISINIG